MKPRLPPDAIPRKLIQAKIHKLTGTLVTEQRIGRWINQGELRMGKAPSGSGYRWYTRGPWLMDLIRRYSA
jgi:hypothetical protein